MVMFLVLIPMLVVISSILIYQFNGRKEFVKFDLVQFLYAFFFVPVMFIWLKSLLFYLLRRELDLHLSVTDIFAADTAFSVMFLFLYAFIVIHSLTKSFELKREHDPLYDLMKDSEYFHLWISHIVFNFGMTLIVSVLSVTNLFIPITTTINHPFFYMLLSFGLIFGIALFVFTWLSNFSANFVRVMKIFYGVIFTIHVGLYITIYPGFDNRYGIFWVTVTALSSFMFCSLFFERFERPMNWIQRLHYKFFKS